VAFTFLLKILFKDTMAQWVGIEGTEKVVLFAQTTPHEEREKEERICI